MEEDNNLEEEIVRHEFAFVGCRLPYSMFLVFKQRLMEEGMSVAQGVSSLIENYLNLGNQ